MKLQTKLLICCNVTLLVLLGYIFVRENYASKIYRAVTKQKVITQTPGYFFKRDELFNALPKDTNAILFVGNSLTEHYELADFFNNAHVKNRGISGDITKGLLLRLSPIIECQPKKIFLEIGINDLFMNIGKDTLLHNYFEIVNRLLIKCPKTKVYVQSLFPISNNSEMLSEFNTYDINAKIKAINDDLKTYCETKKSDVTENQQLLYIDTHSKFGLNNELNTIYTIDGVHLSAKGYWLWTEILTPYVN